MHGQRRSASLLAALLTASMVLLAAPGPAAAAVYQVVCSSGGFACATGGYGAQNLGWPDKYYGQTWEAGLVHNCTRYAAFKLQQNGLGDPGASFGNANQWDDRVRARYGAGAFSGSPRVGAIAQWNSFPGDGGFGHVAYVEEVGADYIRVTDDAYGGGTKARIIPVGHSLWPSNFIVLTGPVNADPFGYLDEATSPGPGYVRVRGWAADPDARTAPIDVHVYANTTGFNLGRADKPRADVGRAYPGYGDSHGFDAQVTLEVGGSYRVCAYGINVPGGNNPALKDCRQVAVADPRPFGYLDGVSSPAPGTIRVRGWAVDPNSPTSAIDVHVYVGEKGQTIGKAGVARPDVGKALPGYGDNHGYDTTVPAPAGTHKVCAYGINVGPGSNQQLKECKTITVAPAPATVGPSAPPPAEDPVGVSDPAQQPGAERPPVSEAPVAAPATLPVKAKRVGEKRVRLGWTSVPGAQYYSVKLQRAGRQATFRTTTGRGLVLRAKPGVRYRATVTARADGAVVARGRITIRLGR